MNYDISYQGVIKASNDILEQVSQYNAVVKKIDASIDSLQSNITGDDVLKRLSTIAAAIDTISNQLSASLSTLSAFMMQQANSYSQVHTGTGGGLAQIASQINSTYGTL